MEREAFIKSFLSLPGIGFYNILIQLEKIFDREKKVHQFETYFFQENLQSN
jgi:hypothetical protein